MRQGTLLIGGGLDQNDLKPVSADDVARQSSRNVIPRFFTSVSKTKDGFREVEYVEILVPGDAKSVPCLRVDENVKKRFAAQYQAWKAGKDQAADGTPLELMVGNGTQLHELRAKNVFTVEALAGLTDGQLDAIGMGARGLRDKARSFLDRSTDMAAVEREAAKDRIISDLQARLARLEGGGQPQTAANGDDGDPVGPVPPEGAVPVTASAPAKRGPGRPKAA